MTALYALAKSYAKPVARGYFDEEDARYWLTQDAFKADLAGHLAPYKPGDVAAGLHHILGLWLKIEGDRRAVATHHIRRLLEPLIARRHPWGGLMAEAHGLNGQEGFPLAEPEVNELVETEVWFALPPAPRSRRHGG